MQIEFRAKRVYAAPSPDDGFRILVDRLWPRGVAKAKAQIDLWAKVLSPSNELRKWFHADPTRSAEFSVRYQAELTANESEIRELLQTFQPPVCTLITATQDPAGGHVAILKLHLEQIASTASG